MFVTDSPLPLSQGFLYAKFVKLVYVIPIRVTCKLLDLVSVETAGQPS